MVPVVSAMERKWPRRSAAACSPAWPGVRAAAQHLVASDGGDGVPRGVLPLDGGVAPRQEGPALGGYTVTYHSLPYHTIPYHTLSYPTIPYHTVAIPPCLYRTTPHLYGPVLTGGEDHGGPGEGPAAARQPGLATALHWGSQAYTGIHTIQYPPYTNTPLCTYEGLGELRLPPHC